MKKVLLAAALIGGTFFSANAEVEEICNDDFFEVKCWDVLVSEVQYRDANGVVQTYRHYERRCRESTLEVIVNVMK